MSVLKKGGALSLIVGAALLLALMALGITEETALGSVRGSVRMSENGMPLPGAAIILTSVNESVDAPKPKVSFADKSGGFNFLNVPAGDYRIEASAKAHNLPPSWVTVKEGAATSLDLELKPREPELRVYSSQRVFLPDEAAEVEAHGFGPGDRLAVRVYKLDVSHFLKEGSIYGVLYSLTDNPYSDRKRQAPETLGTLVASEDHKIQNADAEGTFMDVIKVPKLSEGFYWVQCSMGGLIRGAFLSVTKIALVTKSSPGQTLAFVTDLKTGTPVAGAPVSIDENNAWKAVATTAKDGTVELKMPENRKVLILATMGDSNAISAFYSRAGSGSDEAGDEGDSSIDTTLFTYTDRPIYRPGDDIQFKGFVRRRQGANYVLPGTGKVTCEVRNSSDDLLEQFPMDVSGSGSFRGHFSTADDMAPGDYTFTFKGFGGEHRMYVSLAAYRKPEFSVKVTWSKPHYTMGEKLQATVKCEYYFGGPVAGAKVSASIYRSQVWSDSDGGDEDVYGGEEYSDEYSGGGSYYDDAEGVTDANGEAKFTFDPRNGEEDETEDYAFYTPDYKYTLNAGVAEAGDKYFTGEGSVKVSQGSFNLGVKTDRYMVAPGDDIQVTLSGTSVDTGDPTPGQALQVTYGTETWTRRQSVFTTLGQQYVRLGADGKATLQLKASREGSFLIRVSGQDERGNTVRREGYVYVGTEGFEPPPSAGPLSVTLDKALYKPGETCKALVSLAKPGGTVLLTIESENVLWSKVVRLADRSGIVDIPVLKGYLPRVTVGAACVQDKKFLEASKALKIDVNVRKMRIGIVSDKAKYLPGEIATYRLQANGPDGKPVSADLSLAVVDEAIYALQADSTNPVKAFYPARPNLVETNYSFPELYLDGGDKAGDIPVRKNFKDTAAWVPSIRTDAQGAASVTVTLPDNLTSWRATVVGVSDATDVGMATQNLVVSKPLMVRLQGPRFMVAGDRQDVAAIVTNHSGTDATVRISLQPNGLSTGTRLEQSVRVADGASGSVSWNLEAAQTGKGVLVAKAWVDNGPTDGVQQTLDIKPHARELHYQGAGDIPGSASVQIVRRDDADPSAGELKITVSPTIGTSLYGALDNLIDYPYGCVEQTMSRFLPAMVVGRSLEGVGLLRPDLKKKVPEIARRSFAKLEEMQHYDGGWGWWTYDQSDPFMTAYVLDGLREAKAAGYEASPFLHEKAVQWGVTQINSAGATKWSLRARLYLAYELAMYGKKAEAAKALRTANLTRAGHAVMAIAALTADALGKDWIAQRDRWITEIRTSVIEGTSTAYWAPFQDTTYWWDDQDVYGAEVSALPLLALQRITPEDPIIGKAVRGLLASRVGDWWWSTRDSSFALRAIAAYMSREEMPGPLIGVHVKLNGKPLGDMRLEAKNLMVAPPKLTVPMRQLSVGQNTLQMTIEGSKLAYYSFDLKQFATSPTLGRLVSGDFFTLTRTFHLLRSERIEDGTYRLQASKDPIMTARSGDLIRCNLTVTTTRRRNYLMVTDPFPSNCHVLEDNYQVESYDWSNWYSDRTVYDDRIAFFAREIPAGTHVFSYVLRAESPGIAHALPPVAENMYNPEDRASDGETVFEVRR